MTSKRVYLIMLSVVGILTSGLIGGAYGINQLFSSQAASLTALKAKSSALAQEQTALVKAKRQIKQYADLNQIVSEIVPQQKNQAQAVTQIVDIASRNNITLGSITFPASTLGAAATPTTTGSSTVGSGATAANNPNSKSSKLSQLQPVVGIPGVYYSQIMVQGDPNSSFPYQQFIDFLSDLEHNRGTALINAISIQPDPKNPGYVTFSLTMDEYVKPS